MTGLRISIDKPYQFTIASVVTASRSIGTVFQNLTGRIMLVNVFGTPAAAQSINFNGLTDTANPPTTLVAFGGINQGTAITTMITFAVLPGNFYKVTNTGSAAPNSFTWVEWT